MQYSQIIEHVLYKDKGYGLSCFQTPSREKNKNKSKNKNKTKKNDYKSE